MEPPRGLALGVHPAQSTLTRTSSADIPSTPASASLGSAPCHTSAFYPAPFDQRDDKARITPQSLIVRYNWVQGVIPQPPLRGLLRTPQFWEEFAQLFGRQGQRIPAVLLAERQGLLLVDCPPPAHATSPAHQPECPAGCCRGSGPGFSRGLWISRSRSTACTISASRTCSITAWTRRSGSTGPSPVADCRPASSIRALGRGTAPVPSDPA